MSTREEGGGPQHGMQAEEKQEDGKQKDMGQEHED